LTEFGEWIEKLLAAVDIVTVIGRYIPLARKGRTWWGACPFHHEKTPSFAVNENEQFYHCFGCGESGNAITFIAKYESVERIDAIRMLAEEARMEMPKLQGTDADAARTAKLKSQKDTVIKANLEAARFYHRALMTRENAGYKYLTGRGIGDDIIIKFGLGYSPDYNGLISHMKRSGFTVEDMKLAGLADTNSGGKDYDVFGGRVMVPIINVMGEVVGFGGRVLEKTDFAKYRNTANTVVFDKSKTLYAANLLKKVKQEQGIDYLILCEGYMDVISLVKAGFKTAVASMGTSLTVEQAKLIKRFSESVYISYDGDSAGKKATLRGLDILEDAGLTVRVITLPEGLDPDDVVNKQGYDAYKRLIDTALPLIEFKLKAAESENDLGTSEGRHKFATAALEIIAKLPTAVMQEEYINKIRQKTRYSFENMKAQLAAVSGADADGVERALAEVPQANAVEKAVSFLLSAYISGSGCEDAEVLEGFLEDGLKRELYDYKRAHPGANFAGILEAFPEEAHARIGLLADTGFDEKGADYARGCVRLLKREALIKENMALSEEYANSTDPAARGNKNILRRIADNNTEIQRLK
jgi:DNA primase